MTIRPIYATKDFAGPNETSDNYHCTRCGIRTTWSARKSRTKPEHCTDCRAYLRDLTINCGTTHGYERHRRFAEKPCEDCAAAYIRARKARRNAA